MNKNTFSYKQGFKKGIEIYNENSTNGYYSDQNNERVMNRCKQYADTGYKNNEHLRQTQIDYYLGVYDGIRYQYKQYGTFLPDKKLSKFEQREHLHYYGK